MIFLHDCQRLAPVIAMKNSHSGTGDETVVRRALLKAHETSKAWRTLLIMRQVNPPNRAFRQVASIQASNPLLSRFVQVHASKNKGLAFFPLTMDPTGSHQWPKYAR